MNDTPISRSLYIVVAAYAAGLAGTMTEFMVPPVMPLLHQHFHSPQSIESLFMGAYAAMTILSALVAARLIRRWGTTRVACLGLVWLMLATGVEWYGFRMPSVAVFLIARAVAGVGFGLISVAAPAKIGSEVQHDLVSTGMGIWATWVPVGSLIMFLVAPHLMSANRIGPLLMLQCAADFVAALLLVFTGLGPIDREKKSLTPTGRPPWRKAVMVIAMAFGCFTFDIFAFNTWLSTWLTHDYHWTLAVAGLVGAAGSLFSAGGNLLGGLVMSRMKPALWLFMAVSLLMALGWGALSVHNVVLSLTVILVVNLVGGLIPTLVFLSPNLVAQTEHEISRAMGYIIVGENAGIIVGPWVFSLVMGHETHFSRAFILLGIVALGMAILIGQFFAFERPDYDTE